MDDKNLIVKKDNIFSKIIGKIRNFFFKNKNDTKEFSVPNKNIENKKREFLNNIEFKENTEDIGIINKVRDNKDLIYNMNYDELKRLNEAIENRQKYVDKGISVLKENIMMEKKSTQA